MSAVTIPESDHLERLQEPILDINSLGVVSTKNRLGNAFIMARLVDQVHSQQSILLNVAVRTHMKC